MMYASRPLAPQHVHASSSSTPLRPSTRRSLHCARGSTANPWPSVSNSTKAPLFAALPGAGAVFAPRLLVAFGAPRARYASADERQKYAGIAPVTERSGTKTWVHWRWQCPTCLRQTFVEWAAESMRHSFWARAYSQQQRDKGTSHQAAVRALAFKWIRILFRCWQTRTPYNESVYLNALERRGSPLLHTLANGS